MTKIRAFGLLASLLLAGTVAAHAAPVTGSWKVTIGSSATPCEVTLAAGETDDAGTATTAANCDARAAAIARWSTVADKLTLKSANGETIAVLDPKNGVYSGRQFADSRKVVLSPANSSVAQSQ